MEISSFSAFGSSVNMSADLAQYMDALHKYRSKKETALSAVNDLAEKDSPESVICSSVKEIVTTDIKEIIAELSGYGVYDKTVGDFLPRGYYDDILTNFESSVHDETRRTAQEYYQALEYAREEADSSVSGLPFGIISNSIVGVGVYALQDHSERKRQQAKANADYFVQSQHLEKAYHTSVDNAKTRHREIFVSNICRATEAIYDSLTAAYLTELHACGKFDISCLDGVSVERSCDLLENLSVVASKSEVLRHALLLCPFNPLVYVKAAEEGLFDEALIQLMEYLHITPDVVQAIESSIAPGMTEDLSPAEIIKQYRPQCSALSAIKNESLLQTLYLYFPKVEKRIKERFQAFSAYLNGRKSIQSFSEKYSCELEQYKKDKNARKFVENCTCSEEDIKALTEHFGETEIVAEIADIMKMQGAASFADILQKTSLAAKDIADKALSAIEERRQAEELEKAEKEAALIAERVSNQKKMKRSDCLTLIMIICLIGMPVCLILGCFWVPFTFVGVICVIAFLAILIYLKLFDPYGF